jgi:mandelate racemase
MSSHLMPEVSAHLLCATPTAHWLEYVDWADAIVQEPLVIRDGMVLTSERTGSGIAWDEAKLKRLETISVSLTRMFSTDDRSGEGWGLTGLFPG